MITQFLISGFTWSNDLVSQGIVWELISIDSIRDANLELFVHVIYDTELRPYQINYNNIEWLRGLAPYLSTYDLQFLDFLLQNDSADCYIKKYLNIRFTTELSQLLPLLNEPHITLAQIEQRLQL